MFWIRDLDGDLINLALAQNVIICAPDKEGGVYRARAWFDGETRSNLFKSDDRKQCESFVDHLFAKLTVDQP